ARQGEEGVTVAWLRLGDGGQRGVVEDDECRDAAVARGRRTPCLERLVHGRVSVDADLEPACLAFGGPLEGGPPFVHVATPIGAVASLGQRAQGGLDRVQPR